MFWRRKKPRILDLSNLAYQRYLRSGWRDPLKDFLAYSEDDQETLALIGDAYVLGPEESKPDAKEMADAVRSILGEAMEKRTSAEPFSMKRNGPSFLGKEPDES